MDTHHSRRLSCLSWRKAIVTEDPTVRAEYESMHGRLGGVFTRPRDIALCMSLLYHFSVEFNRIRSGQGTEREDPSLRHLDGTREGAAAASAAWASLKGRTAWSSPHCHRMLVLLSHTLRLHCHAVAVAINPLMRHTAREVRIEAPRSQCREFTLLECLPAPVRVLCPRSLRHRLLVRMGNAAIDHLSSTSKKRLQRFLLFVDLMLFDRGSTILPLLAEPQQQVPLDEPEAWRRLTKMDAKCWLVRYREAYVRPNRCGFACFKTHITFLRLIHNRILCPRSHLLIPVPRRGGRLTSAREDEDEWRGGNQSSSASSFGTTTSTDAATNDDDHVRRLRLLLNEIKGLVCKPEDEPLEDRVHAFTVAEVHRIWKACHNTLERLVVHLFLTTGLRRGGLCRLRCSGAPDLNALCVVTRTPSTLVTVEKNGKRHVVRLCVGARVLLARWFSEGMRPDAPMNPYIFPGKNGDNHMCSDVVYRLCRDIFRRAGITGGHAHPHTFRHTYVYILVMNDKSFDEIAKLVGHSSPQITSAAYGHIRMEDLSTPMDDELQPGMFSPKQEWVDLGQFLRLPVELTVAEAALLEKAGIRSKRKVP